VRFWTRWMAWIEHSDTVAAHWLRAGRDTLLGEMPILAGGTALFAMVAVVPTLAATVALYSVIADPTRIQAHFAGLESVLPPQVVGFVADQLARKAAGSQSELGVAAAVSVFIALVASRGAARALIDSLNRAYRVRERRRPLHKLLVTLAMGGGTLLGILLLLVSVVALPAIFAIAGLGSYAIVQWLRWPVLMSVTFCTLLALYRFAPSPRPLGTVRHLWPGAATATTLLVIVSVGLSIWVDRVAAYDLWYGAFGSAVVVLLWFHLSVMALVVGGFVNAELERGAGAPAPDRSMY
jgi:membrane protein